MPQTGPITALRVRLRAPVASFRDPLFPGVTHCLPVPPPSTLRGMLAAATGRIAEPVTFGVSARAAGRGVDAETYHPIASDGKNPAIGGRVRPGKGGTTLRDRGFLADVHVTLWVSEPDVGRIREALRRPVWGLRLGRSQDLVFIEDLAETVLEPATHATVGHALAPVGGHTAAQAEPLLLADNVSADRLTMTTSRYLWCAEPAGDLPVQGAYRDRDTGEAVWLLPPARPEQSGELSTLLGKSAEHSSSGGLELLTEHSSAVAAAAKRVAARIGAAGPLSTEPRFWNWVYKAALLHDAGKVAEGFQRQLRPRGPRWGERHEVLSLGYVDLLTEDASPRERLMTATGVVFHHRPLVSQRMNRGLANLYPRDADWERKFGRNPEPVLGRPRVQVTMSRHKAWLAWLSDQLDIPVPTSSGRKLWERARDLFAELCDTWDSRVPDDVGLLATLLQGAVTLADHAGSAHVSLQEHMSLPADYLDRKIPTPYPHQAQAARTRGHIVITAPTGSGKTEAGLAWAANQLADMPGQPRLVWVLPYRASINAMRDRFQRELKPPTGEKWPDIGMLHATIARVLLAESIDDDRPAFAEPTKSEALRAKARADAMRLFTQRVRVATPHQLLNSVLGGPRYSSLLLEQANALFVLDELHAYEPTTFGNICALMRLWERLGSRIAVLSATLARPMIDFISESLAHAPQQIATPSEIAPPRHRLIVDPEPLTTEASLDRIRGWLGDGHAVLVVTNTVDAAQEVFDQLADAAHAAHGSDPDAALLLHSRFTARDRAEIERRITNRYPERGTGGTRSGGLVVATQALEVSLCLDFDRGVTELAPIEALAQRAGRVNRRGRHPDGIVEFRVHEVTNTLPYEKEALYAAREALATSANGSTITEYTINTWLNHVYDSPWGQGWLDRARRAREDFTAGLLDFSQPFHDKDSRDLDEPFDTIEVVHSSNLDDYRRHLTDPESDALFAADYLIPLRRQQLRRLMRNGFYEHEPRLGVGVVSSPYDSERGLRLTADGSSDTMSSATSTIL